ncbi:MAG: aldehyde ferredoxin oxidoreductase family protein [Candidatus Desulfaltia sp.]|nr:aldehyde ferredoxin oxidoreductase family protein [Candidatus Desulfaltia sp.]
MYGFYGRILKVDLSTKRFNITTIDEKIYCRYLGGKGLASYLLYTLNPEGVDPLSPANCLIFATGPVTGSVIWGSSRYGVFTKSSQTGLYSESYSGGRVPEAIDSTGFDAIVIMGKSKKPAVLEIHPEGAVFHDAGDIWGMETYEAEDAVNQRFGITGSKRKKTGSVVIGPAGERLVCFAVIENDYWRSAGRTGTGTVMGSKNLKAIVFKGDKRRLLFDKENIKTFSKQVAEKSRDNPSVLAFKSWGTPNMVRTANLAGAFPTRYWAQGFFDGWENISSQALHERCSVKPHACPKCFISCGRMTTVVSGRHAGLKIEGPEYETIYAFGGICLIDSIEEIAYLNDICDRLGMDTITAGNLCGFTIEAARKKRIEFHIDYGDVDGIAGLLKMIAKREGIGDILARGIRYAAKEWNLEDFAVHVKGLEPPGYDPRSLKGSGLAFAVSERGACHLRANFHNPELTGLIDPDVIKNKAKFFVDFEDRLTLMDVLILCRFYKDQCSWEGLSQLIQITTGLKESKESLQKRAAEITDLIRCFNIREGLKPEDDNLPMRLYKKFHKTENSITEDELKAMLKDYYNLRGWDQNGLPKVIIKNDY